MVKYRIKSSALSARIHATGSRSSACLNALNRKAIFPVPKIRLLAILAQGSGLCQRAQTAASALRASEPRSEYVGLEDEFRQPIFCAQCQTLIAQLCLLCVLKMHDVEIEQRRGNAEFSGGHQFD
mgnify:CR=1 FL=1